MGVLRNRQEKPTLCDVINEGDSHFGNNVIHHMFLMLQLWVGVTEKENALVKVPYISDTQCTHAYRMEVLQI